MRASTDPPIPRLHVLVSERELERPDGLAQVERIVERAAPNAVHLRTRLTARRRYEISERLAHVADRAQGWLVVTGRPDIALAAGAQAVQLGRSALGVGDTRALVEARAGRLFIGASVHDPETAAKAVRAGADYLVLGTIFRTASHRGVEGSGPEAIAHVRARLSAERSTPILAIGGVSAERLGEVIGAGAHGVVVGRAVWAASDPLKAALELRSELDALQENMDADVG